MSGGVEVDPAALGVVEAASALQEGALSSVELTEACLRRIEAVNGGPPTADGSPQAINAFVRLYPERALGDARAADERRAREGPATPPLCGVPLAVKDLYGVEGLPVTASSRVLEGNVATRDAPVVAALRGAGMVVIGHTHTHEFAAGGTTDQVGNPFDLGRSAGGSSGGSAAALAARMVPAALGTDTCGSLRIPSAFCGTSTVKATHGRVSIEGIVPLAPSLDHAGPMARTVADAAALLSVMATVPEVTPLFPPPAPLGTLALGARRGARPLAGLVCALTSHAGSVHLDAEVAAGFETARRALAELGATIVELDAPYDVAADDLDAVMLTEVWSYHRRHAALGERYRPSIAEFVEVASRFEDATTYLAAQQRRAEGAAAWERWFAANRVDVVLEPTVPVLPPLRGPGYERGHRGGVGDPLIALTALWDLTGMPVVALPVARHVGASLVGPRGQEGALVQVGIDLQSLALGVPD